jgi:regulator of RNase E activity RraB
VTDCWNFYPLLVDSEPASIFVDLGIAESAPLADMPNLIYLRVFMNDPRSDGLSSQEEYATLIALEDSISETVRLSEQAIYVGRNTSSGNRDFYFYARDTSFEIELNRAMEKWPSYKFETGARFDDEWSTYWNFLYPSPEDFQRIGNRDVIGRLIKKGDRIDVPRKIDHYAVFRTEADRDAFARHIRSSGFRISEETIRDDGYFGIEFDKSHQPSKIDDVTIDLYRAARKNNGDYDGWGCVVAG